MLGTGNVRHVIVWALAGCWLVGCGDDGSMDGGGDVEVPETYSFESRFVEGESSVSYDGQVLRQVLIDDMTTEIDGLTAEIDNGDITPAEGDIEARLLFYYEFDESGLDVDHKRSTTPAAEEETYEDISSSAKSLQGKLAGNDEKGQHKDWTEEGNFVGWDEDGIVSPEDLLLSWFEELDQLAVDRANGTVPQDPDGNPISEVYVTADGRDLKQLIEKFTRGAVAFSQGADDYLDDDTEGKGLLTDNTMQDGDSPYTALEHQWDEGFGYFGAARNYSDYTDEQIADGESIDADDDGEIDLSSEHNFGHSVNAGKRDRGSADSAMTNFTAGAFDAFLEGRAIISGADGELSDAQMDALVEQRDIALENWEKAIAATVVHYINDTLQDMNDIGSDDYSFNDHATHWSELKGFALVLQFNRHSPLSDDDFATLHELLGDAPVLSDGDVDGYQDDLLEARDLMQSAYGFDDANMGDEDGEGGW